MNSNFSASVARVLADEGGFVDDPHDPGGATNMGITMQTLAQHRGVVPYTNLTVGAMRNLSNYEARDIYRGNYWDALDCDALPAGLDYALFDFGVNSGPARAAKTLQTIVGVSADGVVGPQTLDAISRKPVQFIITRLDDERLALLRALPTWQRYGNGWSQRVARVTAAALKMAAQPSP